MAVFIYNYIATQCILIYVVMTYIFPCVHICAQFHDNNVNEKIQYINRREVLPNIIVSLMTNISYRIRTKLKLLSI